MRWLLLLTLLFTVAFTPADPEKQQAHRINKAIGGTVVYLNAEYARGAFGLLPESPGVRRNKYWVATDAQVAVYALREAGQDTFAAQLTQARQRADALPHGLVEALDGTRIKWPPHQEHQYVLVPGKPPPAKPQPNVCSETTDAPENVICQEIRDRKLPTFQDWAEYADLALYGALNACNQGNQALALYVGVRLGKPTNDTLLTALLAKQDDETGGFTTLYDGHGVRKGDSNTETTAYALLALATIQNGAASQGGDSHCPRP